VFLEFLSRPMRPDALRASFFAAGNQCPSQPCGPISAHSDHLFFQGGQVVGRVFF